MKKSCIKLFQSLWREKWKHAWEVVEWPFLVALALFTIVCGVIGFAAYFSHRPEAHSLADYLYMTLQLFTIQSGSLAGDKTWYLEFARFMAPLLSGYAALQALLVIFHRQILLIRLAIIKNHIIICGLGRKGYMLAADFWSKGYDVAIIELDEHNTYIPIARAAGMPVLTGNAADALILQQARLLNAEKVICVCGDDGVNAEIAMMTQILWQKQTRRTLQCFVHIVEPAVWNLLHGRKFAFDSTSLHMEFFNIYDWGAKRILEKYPAFASHDSTQTPSHLLIVGLGKFGASLLIHIARAWFWQIRDNPKAKKLHITVIDKMAVAKVQRLLQQYPRLQDACRLHPIETDIRWFDAQSPGNKILFAKKNPVQKVYICLDNDSLALHSAGVLQNLLTNRQTPIIIRMAVQTGLAALLTAGRQDSTDVLHVFHLLNETCHVEALQDHIDVLAQTIHEGYLQHGRSQGAFSTDLPAQKPWNELARELQDSNRDQAHHLPKKLHKIGYRLKPLCDWQADRDMFSPEQVEALAEMEHNRWLAERLSAGWRLGPNDLSAKTNPHIKPWPELDEATKEFDRNAVRLIPMLLAKIDLQIYACKKNPEIKISGGCR